METLGIFPDVESAGRAVAGLIQAGFVEAQITSLTSVAYPDGVLVRVEKRSFFRWVSLAGAAAGACAGFGLAAGTAWLYPVQTGDKPIIALFPTSIVTFEVTMLCAIIGALAGAGIAAQDVLQDLSTSAQLLIFFVCIVGTLVCLGVPIAACTSRPVWKWSRLSPSKLPRTSPSRPLRTM